MYIVYHLTGTLSLNVCTLKPHLSGFDGKKSSGEAKFQYPMVNQTLQAFSGTNEKTPEIPALIYYCVIAVLCPKYFLIQLLL